MGGSSTRRAGQSRARGGARRRPAPVAAGIGAGLVAFAARAQAAPPAPSGRHRRLHRSARGTGGRAGDALGTPSAGAAGAGEHHRLPPRRRPGAAPVDRRQDHHRPRGDRALRRLHPRRRAQAPARRHDPGPAGPRRRDPPARPRQRLHPDPARRRARAAGLLARFDLARSDRADRDPARADRRDRRPGDRRHDQHHHPRGLHAGGSTTCASAPPTRTARSTRRPRGRATSARAR